MCAVGPSGYLFDNSGVPAGPFPRQTLGSALPGRSKRRLLCPRRAFLRRHGFEAPFAADLAALAADLTHDLAKQRPRFLVHPLHLKTV